MRTKPAVGQVVRLNDHGYDHLHLTTGEAIRQSQRMTITHVENLGRGSDPIWSIDVDQPAINKFMLDALMVEPI